MQMALCFQNESAKTEPYRIANGSLRSRKLYPERGEERERCLFSVIQFPYGFLRVFFFIRFLRIPLFFLVQYPLFPITLPINLSHSDALQFDSTMTAIFNTALCEVKISLNIELT
jgi:hypothetical protein